MPTFMIYGANGYTGSLIAAESVGRGLRPILAGRNAVSLSPLAAKLGLEQRVFALNNPQTVAEALDGIAVVLHCAGPFSQTSRAMVDGCLRSKVHYLDITGEIAVFEAVAKRGAEAREAGVMLLPGVGYDVVPSDCLAAHLKGRLPAATHLALGMQSFSQFSRGTALTMVENLDKGGMIRRAGVLQPVPAAWNTRVIDCGRGPIKAITIPWGDVSTAYFSTGIPNIEMYLAAPWKMRVAARASRFLGWALRSALVQGYLTKRILNGPPGPTDAQRAQGSSLFWGEAMDDAGNKVEARLQCPEGYTLTARAALAVVERVLAGDVKPGFQTPSLAYGADFALGIEGIVRKDV